MSEEIKDQAPEAGAQVPETAPAQGPDLNVSDSRGQSFQQAQRLLRSCG